ncbi:craniofacial development protein 2-like protein [Plakobranchus ocellatus]|uniref:Craniofacial development protein 2-like protein n=1 Tax=Plakobranchus ocellatus TaxID=259542 RepID=A0AAV4B1P5_9GAST|nr:craniofacial development protein 2-like protein [Plakobranchus ocellatus]
MNLNILRLAEVRWTGAGSMKLGSKTLIYSGGHTHERGVGISFDVTMVKGLGSWCPISDRVVEAKPLNLGIIRVYAPTSDSEDVEVEQFYEEIEKAKGYLKSPNIIIVMGDFNAKVGDERVEDVVGPSGIGTVNDRGSRLIEWCQVNDFTITNTKRQRTWKSPGDRSRNKIDYILIQKRFRNTIKTSKSLPGADCDSDHILVMCTFKIILKKLRKAKAYPKFQMDLLKSDEKLKDKIAIAVHNKYETLKNISKVEELWSEMKNSLYEITEKKKYRANFTADYFQEFLTFCADFHNNGFIDSLDFKHVIQTS